MNYKKIQKNNYGFKEIITGYEWKIQSVDNEKEPNKNLGYEIHNRSNKKISWKSLQKSRPSRRQNLMSLKTNWPALNIQTLFKK